MLGTVARGAGTMCCGFRCSRGYRRLDISSFVYALRVLSVLSRIVPLRIQD